MQFHSDSWAGRCTGFFGVGATGAALAHLFGAASHLHDWYFCQFCHAAGPFKLHRP
jgi:hypothetical protein